MKHYHRRMNSWTYDSLRDCLEHLFASHTRLARHPGILRFLQLYLLSLDDSGAIKNVQTLSDALQDATPKYLTTSLNVLTGSKKTV